MLWFNPKKFKLVISDKEIEKEVRSNSYFYIIDLLLKKGLPYIAELIREEKLSPNFLQAILQLIQLEQRGSILFRGINKRNYRDFLRYGNTKTAANVSEIEAETLRIYGLEPSQILWADTNLSKAWEYVKNKNPSIVVLYDATKLERIPNEWFLYRLKAGHNFKDAVKAYVIIWYR